MPIFIAFAYYIWPPLAIWPISQILLVIMYNTSDVVRKVFTEDIIINKKDNIFCKCKNPEFEVFEDNCEKCINCGKYNII